MEEKKPCAGGQSAQATPLTESDLTQAAGGHSHARSEVFRARRPEGGLSSYTCKQCGVTLPDAGAFFEHRKMVHGG